MWSAEVWFSFFMKWKLLQKKSHFVPAVTECSLYASTYNAVCSSKELIMLSCLSWCRPLSVFILLCCTRVLVCTEILHGLVSYSVFIENQCFPNICMNGIAIKLIYQYCLSLFTVSSTKMFIAQHCNDNKCTFTYYLVSVRNVALPVEIMWSLLISTLDLYLPLGPLDCTTLFKVFFFWTYSGATERDSLTLFHFVDSSNIPDSFTTSL